VIVQPEEGTSLHQRANESRRSAGAMGEVQEEEGNVKNKSRAMQFESSPI